jgi:hypothetical protein
VNLITHSKTRANPESNVALMTLSDLAVLVTLTTDTGKILAKLHQVRICVQKFFDAYEPFVMGAISL